MPETSAPNDAVAPPDAAMPPASMTPEVEAPAAAAAPAVDSSPPQPALPPMPPAECAQALRQLFPALFSGPAKPFKLRIQVDIQQRAPNRFSKQTLSAFFRRHTGSTAYLMAMTKATQRFDLDGLASGEVTAEHRQVALEELQRRRGNQQQREVLEAQQERNRATLLRDYETTTLTPANFAALKGVVPDELEGLLGRARAEAVARNAEMNRRVTTAPERGSERPGPHRPQDGPRGPTSGRPHDQRSRSKQGA